MAVGLSGVLRVGVSGAAMGSISLYQQRLGALLHGSSLYSADVGIVDSPLQLRIGPVAAGGAHRGAVVGNLVVCAGTLAGGLAGGVWWLVCIRRSHSRLGMATWSAAALLVRAPGLWLGAVVLPLLSSTVLSSVVLLQGGTDAERAASVGSGWRRVDEWVGGCGVCVCGAILGDVARRLAWPPFAAVFCALPEEVAMARRHCRPWAVAVLGAGNYGVWRDGRQRGFVARSGLLFEGSRRGRHWWLLCDVLQSVVVSIATATASGGATAGAVSWCLVGLQTTWVGAQLLLSPFRLFVDRCVGVVLGLLCVAAAVVAAADLSDTAGDVLLGVSVCVTVAGAVVPVVAESALVSALLRRGFAVEGLGRPIVIDWHYHILKMTLQPITSPTAPAKSGAPAVCRSEETSRAEEVSEAALQRLVAMICAECLTTGSRRRSESDRHLQVSVELSDLPSACAIVKPGDSMLS